MLEVSASPPAEVYNLEVESSHEYFANGVLVHNCDCLRYASQHPMRYIPPPKAKGTGKSWAYKYMEAKRKRRESARRGGGGVAMF